MQFKERTKQQQNRKFEKSPTKYNTAELKNKTNKINKNSQTYTSNTKNKKKNNQKERKKKNSEKNTSKNSPKLFGLL